MADVMTLEQVRDEITKIEDAIAKNKVSASWVFTHMRQLISVHMAKASDDARDAARYRYLRESCGEFVRYAGAGDHWLLEEGKLDTAVDTAMAGEVKS